MWGVADQLVMVPFSVTAGFMVFSNFLYHRYKLNRLGNASKKPVTSSQNPTIT